MKRKNITETEDKNNNSTNQKPHRPRKAPNGYKKKPGRHPVSRFQQEELKTKEGKKLIELFLREEDEETEARLFEEVILQSIEADQELNKVIVETAKRVGEFSKDIANMMKSMNEMLGQHYEWKRSMKKHKEA